VATEEGRVAIQDAHERAAVRQHVADVEVSDVVRDGLRARRPRSLEPAPAFAPPTPVVSSAVTAGELRSLLSAMADELGGVQPTRATLPPPVADLEEPVRRALIRFEPRSPGPASAEDPWMRFWDRRPGSDDMPRPRRGLRNRMVTPLVLASSAAALAATWFR
jgi:hypothetical protein